jgi:DNA polymerase-4
MSEENTFGSDVADRATLEAAILTHAESVGRRLRRSELRAHTVVLKLKLGRRVAAGPRGFPQLTRHATLAEPTDDGEVLAQTARALLARAELAEPVRLIGVGATNLVPAARGHSRSSTRLVARGCRLNRARPACERWRAPWCAALPPLRARRALPARKEDDEGDDRSARPGPVCS